MEKTRMQEISELFAAGGKVCELCGRRMLLAEGCTWGGIALKGKIYKRIAYGEDAYDIDDRCPDCGAKQGHLHHFGCDVELSPWNGLQLIGENADWDYTDEKPNA